MNMKDVVVYRSGVLWEADRAAATLDEAGVPFFRRIDELGLGELAMPALPAAGPGTLFLVLVPQALETRAREILGRLPPRDEADTGLWAFRPSRGGKRLFRLYAVIILAVVAVVFGSMLFEAFMFSVQH